MSDDNSHKHDSNTDKLDVGQPILLPWMMPQGEANLQVPGGVIVQQQHEYLDKLQLKQGRPPRKAKSFYEQLMFRSGTCYFTGITAGSVGGYAYGLHKSRGFPNLKLRVNAMLNQGGKIGSTAANTLGVMAILYTFSRSMLNTIRKKDTWHNQVGAGAIAGALFRAGAGPMHGLIGGVTVGAIVFGGVTVGEHLDESTGGKSAVADFLTEFF